MVLTYNDIRACLIAALEFNQGRLPTAPDEHMIECMDRGLITVLPNSTFGLSMDAVALLTPAEDLRHEALVA